MREKNKKVAKQDFLRKRREKRNERISVEQLANVNFCGAMKHHLRWPSLAGGIKKIFVILVTFFEEQKLKSK